MSDSYDFAIIGAGLAGSFCADTLQNSNSKLCVLEKSRGTGGRLSSRRFQSLSYDLGSPCLHLDPEQFRDELMQWQHEGVLKRWPEADHDPYLAYVGRPRMSSLTRHLIGDAEMHTLTRVERLEYLGDSWQLKDANEQTICYSKGLIICAPARQTCALLAGTPCSTDWLIRSHTSSQTSRAQWCMAIEVNHELPAPAYIAPDNSIITRIVNDSQKPGRENKFNLWMIQADSEWSIQYADSHHAQVQKELEQEFCRIMQLEQEDVTSQSPHRWNLARHERTPGAIALWDSELKLGIAADWLGEANINSALLSARTLCELIRS